METGPRERFTHAYEGRAPWDIGRPQRAVAMVELAGGFGRRVLDAGCGTGENALHLASRGHEVVGIDAVPKAVEEAARKAAERGLAVRFEAADVLAEEAAPLAGAPFDSVLDCGFFHALSDGRRPLYLAALERFLVPGGTVRILCFSDKVPGGWGPRRISRGELEAFFPKGWTVDVTESVLESAHPAMPEVPAWLAAARRAAR